MKKRDNSKITTIKLNKKTKDRLEKLRAHKRETYDEILQSMLNIFNSLRLSPEKARSRLIRLERQARALKRKK